MGFLKDTQLSKGTVTGTQAWRPAIKQRRNVRFDYQREDCAKSSLTVHPPGLFYWGKVWTPFLKHDVFEEYNKTKNALFRLVSKTVI